MVPIFPDIISIFSKTIEKLGNVKEKSNALLYP
jgi:hypothetical protein